MTKGCLQWSYQSLIKLIHGRRTQHQQKHQQEEQQQTAFDKETKDNKHSSSSSSSSSSSVNTILENPTMSNTHGQIQPDIILPTTVKEKINGFDGEQFTAGIIVAKGSILRGESTDIYTQPLCARLCYLNIETRRILILPEEEHLLSQEISSFSRMFTYVFVRGIIAKGQWTGNGKFIVHDKLVKFLQNVAKLSEKDALELSTLPSCFQLTWISDDSLPIIQSDNIFYLLDAFNTQLDPLLHFQSFFTQAKSSHFITPKLSIDRVTRIWQARQECLDRLESLHEHPKISAKVNTAINIIEKAFQTFGVNDVALSFNGGKDCTLVLFLMVALLHKYMIKSNPPNIPIKDISLIPVFYVTNPEGFKEVDDFIDLCVEIYGLKVFKYPPPIRSALESFVSQSSSLRSIIIGTRSTDPHSSHLLPIQSTDPSWPQIMRVHPILDWTFNDVWTILRHVHMKYCSLYDQGYTSLGGIRDTLRNESLRRPDGSWEPAWKLANGELERHGRLNKQQED